MKQKAKRQRTNGNNKNATVPLTSFFSSSTNNASPNAKKENDSTVFDFTPKEAVDENDEIATAATTQKKKNESQVPVINQGYPYNEAILCSNYEPGSFNESGEYRHYKIHVIESNAKTGTLSFVFPKKQTIHYWDASRLEKHVKGEIKYVLPLNPETGLHDIPKIPEDVYEKRYPDELDAKRNCNILDTRLCEKVFSEVCSESPRIKIVTYRFANVEEFNKFIVGSNIDITPIESNPENNKKKYMTTIDAKYWRHVSNYFKKSGFDIQLPQVKNRPLSIEFIKKQELMEMAKEIFENYVYSFSSFKGEEEEEENSSQDPEPTKIEKRSPNLRELIKGHQQPLISYIIKEWTKAFGSKEVENLGVISLFDKGANLTAKQTEQLECAFYWMRIQTDPQFKLPQYEQVLKYYSDRGRIGVWKKTYDRNGLNSGRCSKSGNIRNFSDKKMAHYQKMRDLSQWTQEKDGQLKAKKKGLKRKRNDEEGSNEAKHRVTRILDSKPRERQIAPPADFQSFFGVEWTDVRNEVLVGEEVLLKKRLYENREEVNHQITSLKITLNSEFQKRTGRGRPKENPKVLTKDQESQVKKIEESIKSLEQKAKGFTNKMNKIIWMGSSLSDPILTSEKESPKEFEK